MIPRHKSVVLITVDCLRADHVGFLGYPRPTTPFLDSLAAQSFVFRNAIVAGAPTYYSLPSVFASRHPLALGRDVLGIAPGEATLASVLKAAGYLTAGFSAANPYVSARFGYEQGFDVFEDSLHRQAERPLEPEGRRAPGWRSRLNRLVASTRPYLGPLASVYDEAYFRYCQRITPVPASVDQLRRFPAADRMVDQACQWLGSADGSPLFLWLHLMDPHAPYYPKDDALRWMGEKSPSGKELRYLNSFWNRSDLGSRRRQSRRDRVMALYDAGIRWADSQIAELVAALQRANRWQDTVFAVTADHGEEFLDHGGRYHPPSGLLEELIRVPLLLRVPGEAGNQFASPFSLVHLAPTILHAAGMTPPPDFAGTSHWPRIRDPRDSDGVAISECVAGCTNPFHAADRMGPRILSVRESRFKLVVFFGNRTEQLYDLEADPGERKPLPGSEQRPTRRRLLELAHEHLRRSLLRRDPTTRLRARMREIRLEWGSSERAQPPDSVQAADASLTRR